MKRLVLVIIPILVLVSGLPSGRAKTKVAIASMTVNGLRVKNLACVLGSGGFFAIAKVVGALAAKKRALKACAPKPIKPRVAWSFSGGRAVAIVVTRTPPKVASCVTRAMKQVRTDLSGTCSATLLLP